MHDAVVVGVLERIANLRHDGQCLARGHAAGADHLPEVDAIDILHEKEKEVACLPELVERDDVRMIEPRQRLSFAGEARGERRIAPDVRRQYLESHKPVEPPLPRAVDGSHSAAAEQRLDVEPGEERRERFDCRRREARDRTGRSGVRHRPQPHRQQAVRTQAHQIAAGHRLAAP